MLLAVMVHFTFIQQGFRALLSQRMPTDRYVLHPVTGYTLHETV